MDYVSKDDENIIFTLCQVQTTDYRQTNNIILTSQASDTVRMSNASTIYVQDDETTTSYIRTDHENMAYVEEEDPRND